MAQLCKYNIVHKESGDTVTVEVNGFDRDKILEIAGKELGKFLDPNVSGQVRIHPA
tara:strand:- start:958 stop:1125 length:168 start_codon:yes stop_codon:yes gene_type:complete